MSFGKLRANGEKPFFGLSVWGESFGNCHSQVWRSIAANVLNSYIAKFRAGHWRGPRAKGLSINQSEKMASLLIPSCLQPKTGVYPSFIFRWLSHKALWIESTSIWPISFVVVDGCDVQNDRSPGRKIIRSAVRCFEVSRWFWCTGNHVGLEIGHLNFRPTPVFKIKLTIGVLIRRDSRRQAWTKFILRRLAMSGSPLPIAARTSARARLWTSGFLAK